jgi:uncharacterized protein YkwD
MMRSFLAAVFLFSFTGISCIATNQPQVAGVSTTIDTRDAKIVAMEADVLTLINNYRKAKGLSTFVMNDVVSEEARKHSANMASGKAAFGHDGFNTRAKTITSKVPGIMGVAENVAFGQHSAQEVVTDWIKSTGHRHNIEGNYTQTGIGIVADKSGVLYYTQMFTR